MTGTFKTTVDFLKGKGFGEAEAGFVLGTGLHQIISHVDIAESIDYSDIPGFPHSDAPSFHKGKLIMGKINQQAVIIMQGRFHFYEGYSMEQIVFPVRIMKLLGIRHLFLSNAAGGINPEFKKGDLVCIDDYINLQPSNPLIGGNPEELGPRFPDMSAPVDQKMMNALLKSAGAQNLTLKKGVYAAVMGPMLETRAEYRYLRTIGADMVGMSTVPEIIAATHMGLPLVAVSVITDECDPDNLSPVNIEEIIRVAGEADQRLTSLFLETLKLLGK
jgi:purine-nucleoside phosphorylase